MNPSNPWKMSYHSSRSGKPRCSHMLKERSVDEAPVSITGVKVESLIVHGRWDIRFLELVCVEMAIG